MNWRKILGLSDEIKAIREKNQSSIQRLEVEKKERVIIDARLKAIEVDLDVMARRRKKEGGQTA